MHYAIIALGQSVSSLPSLEGAVVLLYQARGNVSWLRFWYWFLATLLPKPLLETFDTEACSILQSAVFSFCFLLVYLCGLPICLPIFFSQSCSVPHFLAFTLLSSPRPSRRTNFWFWGFPLKCIGHSKKALPGIQNPRQVSCGIFRAIIYELTLRSVSTGKYRITYESPLESVGLYSPVAFGGRLQLYFRLSKR